MRRRAAAHLEPLPVLAQHALGDLLAHLTDLDGCIGEYDAQQKLAARDDEQARRLMNLRGVGPVGASAIVATVGSAHEFRNVRQFAAWLGMVPRQYNSGGKARLGRITKAGDAYLRTLLIMGARAVLAAAAGRTDRISRWALAAQARCGYMRAVVGIAAKNARLARNAGYLPQVAERSSPNLGARIDDQANDKAGHYQSCIDDRKAIQLRGKPVAEPRDSEANCRSDECALA